jgi:predicted transcriptional regulator
MSILLSFRTEESVRDELDKIAENLDRNRNWVINEAINNYLALYRWQIDHIEQGMRDSDAGRTHSPEEIRAHFAKRHAEARKTAKR